MWPRICVGMLVCIGLFSAGAASSETPSYISGIETWLADLAGLDLADRGLMVEDWGDETVAVPLSALRGEGIPDLLEMILLTADLLEKRMADAVGQLLDLHGDRRLGQEEFLCSTSETTQANDCFKHL